LAESSFVKSLLLSLRFVLEISMLAGLAIGTAVLIGGTFGWVCGAVVAVLAAGIWGVFIAPKAEKRLPTGKRITVEIILFVAAGGLLIGAGEIIWGAALIALYAFDTMMILLMGITEEDFIIKPPER
jgi:hypothetical protein